MTRTLGVAVLGFVLLWPIARTGADPVATGIYLQVADGALVKAPDDTRVYLVDRGVLRLFTGKSYERLYTDYDRICTVVEIPRHLVQAPLGNETRLAKTKDDAHVWLIDNGHTKRHVSSVSVFCRYGFSWHCVQIVPPEEIDYLPTGSPLH